MDFNVLVQKSYSKPSKNTNFGVKDGGDRNLELLQNIIYNAPCSTPNCKTGRETEKGNTYSE